MALPASFIQAWHSWVRAKAPIKNAPLRRRLEATYPIELELDHLQSNLYSMGVNIIAGKILPNYFTQSNENLKELAQLKLRLESCVGKDADKEKLQRYISQTEIVSREIQKYLETRL